MLRQTAFLPIFQIHWYSTSSAEKRERPSETEYLTQEKQMSALVFQTAFAKNGTYFPETVGFFD